ncbi:MAG TPA: Gfo/Idh/MocA family oxidoreductase [Burkholderiaceae bacterium]|nr:Gfo/Idh/MocA family oxidoreductase [Burkholderiaceae bacterium]
MKKVRYAVVGAGWISQEAFLPAVEQTGNSEVVALVSGDLAKAKQLAAFYGIRDIYAYEQFDAMARSGAVDAVYIATPNSSHARYAERAADHRLHILVEKPLATTAAEAESMVAAANAAGVHLVTAYRLHNDPGTIKVMEMIREGAIGDPRYFWSAFCFQIAAGNHRLRKDHWGGPLQDLGVYCVNAARHVFAGEPVEVHALSAGDSDDPRFAEVDAGITATMRFEGSRIASFYAGFGSEATDVFQVLGTRGSLELQHAYLFGAARTILLKRGAAVDRIDVPETDNFSGMIACFSDCILQGTRPLVDSGEGLADMRALLAIVDAAERGAPVRLTSRRAFTPLQRSMLRSFPPARRRLVLA